MSRSSKHEKQALFFRIALNKDFETDCWTPQRARDYEASIRLYNKYNNGRTYERFLRDMLGKRYG